jgi:FkbM family methyltransferase
MIPTSQEMLRRRLAEQLRKAAPEPLTPQPDYSHIDLLSLPTDEVFVSEAYRRILGRPPDLDGFQHFMRALQSISREAVITALQQAAASRPGTARKAAAADDPPAAVDLTPLTDIEAPEDFIRECYRRILRREPDSAGLRHYWRLLWLGVPKTQVMGILAASSEGRARHLTFLYQGNPLSKARLSLSKRLQLLVLKLTGVWQLEEGVAALRTQTQALQRRHEALHEHIQQLATRLADAQTATVQLFEIHRQIKDAGTQHLLEGIQELRREMAQAHAANAQGLAAAQQQLLAASAKLLEEVSLLHGAAPDSGASGFKNVLDKLDAVAEDIRIRQDGIAARQDAIVAGQSRATETLLLKVRPPVLAGKDLHLVRVGEFMLAIPLKDLSLAGRYAYWGAVDQGLSRCITATLQPGMIFADIGANVGLHTLEAARAVGPTGKVYSFEPTPRTLAALRQNLELNEITGVEVFPAAVLDKGGEAALYLNESLSAWNTVFPDNETTESVRVPAVTLDEALRGRERVDVVKIDVEGAEPLVLRGMTNILRENPGITLIIEFSASHLERAGIQPRDYLQQLRDLGFRIRRIDDFTGDLLEAQDEDLLAAASSNLHLKRENHHDVGIS